MSLMSELNAKALALNVPLSVHLDVTYRCNERCEHCYLEHDDKGEMTITEIADLLGQLAEAGVFFLTISGGEPLMRRDFFQILSCARALLFNVKLKTNGVMIREMEAQRIRELGVEQVQISVYSHRDEIHDAITKLPGSLKKTLRAIAFLKSRGLKVSIANVLMQPNLLDAPHVQRLAKEMGVGYTLDPTITPMINGDTAVLKMRAPREALRQAFRDPALVGNVNDFCSPPVPADDSALGELPCSAGHTSCYISPYGDLYPCVQFPLPSGNVRHQKFIDIWRNSDELNDVRRISARDLPTCSSCAHVASCTRCPGLAYMEGDMRGPSTADCEKSFVRTGVPSANMVAKARLGPQRRSLSGLIQIQIAATS